MPSPPLLAPQIGIDGVEVRVTTLWMVALVMTL